MKCAVMLAVMVLAPAAMVAADAASGSRGSPTPGGRGVEAALAAGVKFLASHVDANGCCDREPPAGEVQFGQQTALSAYAMTMAGEGVQERALAAALKWLMAARLHGTGAISMRACALAAVREPWALEPLKADVDWLVGTLQPNGAYGAEPNSSLSDNTDSQWALAAVAAGARRGVEVPPDYWPKVERHWVNQQQSDGGWGYNVPAVAASLKTYGSTTAGGLASLYICFDRLRNEDFVLCDEPPVYKPITAALAWMNGHFSIDENPVIHDNRYYHWLHGVARVGLSSGRKYIGGHDWYLEGCSQLLARQESDGSWGYGDVTDTCLAMLFLARGRSPILFSKLDYGGKWNCRPRDLANLTEWLAYDLERPLGWQIVELKGPVSDWQDSPILYISGAGPFEPSADEEAKLRTYVLEGGMIVSEAACNNGDFTLDMNRLYGRLFPQYPISRLAGDHPLYKAFFPVTNLPALTGVSNGVRMLAVHCPRELSLGLQLGESNASLPSFELGANLCFLATDRGVMKFRGLRNPADAGSFTPAATVRVARLKYHGNYDPEPLAWARFAAIAGREYRLKVEAAEPMSMTELDANRWPAAAMTGTDAFHLSVVEAQSLADYVRAGGTLILDAAGGSKAFDESVRNEIIPLWPRAAEGPINPRHEILAGPVAVDRISYRKSLALLLGENAHESRLRSVELGGRLAVIYSPDDLTAALMGYWQYGIRGYTPDTAVKLLANIVCYANGVKTLGK